MRTFTLASLVAWLACGCGDRDAPAATIEGSAATPTTRAPSLRAGLVSIRPLLDEVVRAEIDLQGPWIDFGSADQHKYTRGGWLTGWGERDRADGTDSVRLTSRRGFLELGAPRTAPKAIAVRARSRTVGQSLSFHVGDRELGSVELGREWAVHRVALRNGAIPTDGRLRLEVRGGTKGDDGVYAELDWLWLAAADGDPPPPSTVTPLAIGGNTRRALVAPTARAFSFYLQPPAGAQFVVDLGATERVELSIAVTTDGGERTELLRETIEQQWIERAVSLEPYAGRPIRLELVARDQKGIAAWGEPELMTRTPPAPLAPAGTPPQNVILIVMDTMRADAFATFAGADHVARTPVFDALAKKSTVFAAAYDNENWTKPSVATTLSGLYPSTHDTKHDASKLPSDIELITERLKREGFTTAGFVANGYVSDKFGFEQGWDVFENYIRQGKPSEAEHVFADALAWHAKHTKQPDHRPFFLYLQTIDPHVTYRVDREYWSPHFEGDYDGPLGSSIDATDQVKLSTKKLAGSKRDIDWLRALYWGEVGYHDVQLGKFLAELEARGALKNTLLVLTNDHGEELGERGRFGHGHQAFEEMIRAPLIVHYPPVFPAQVVPEIVEHVDLAPTILDALGRDPLAEADGVSFLPLARGVRGAERSALIEFLDGRRILRVGSWKLHARSNGDAALFDLAADPREKIDASGTALIARRMCEIHLGEALATPDKKTRMQGLGGKRRFRAGEAVIDPQMRRQLEALGYFGSTAETDAKD